jgi:hypothetical protein
MTLQGTQYSEITRVSTARFSLSFAAVIGGSSVAVAAQAEAPAVPS